MKRYQQGVMLIEALIGILIFRPKGLFGKAVAEKV